MKIIEIIYLVSLLAVSVISVKTDISKGMVYNKPLLGFAILSGILNTVYYGFIQRGLFFEFIINFVIIAVISLFLYATHSFAGGDCKLVIVMALLYPAGLYGNWENIRFSLFFAVGIAIFLGYVYLLVSAVIALLQKKNVVTQGYIKNYLVSFVKSFVTALIYISLVTIMAYIFGIYRYSFGAWLTRIVCIFVAWMVGKFAVLKKWYVIAITFVIDVILGIATGIMPVSIYPENYILVIALMLCQMTIKTNLYENIVVDELKKGMILSTVSSMLMQNSRIRGLPGISAENLSNRLSEEEVSSIKRWANGNNITSLSIVRKIPFAIFIVMGFWVYMLWGFLSR